MRTVINQDAGVSTVVDLAQDGTLTTGTVQDCTAIAENAKAMHNEGRHGSSEFKLAATLPNVLVEQYMNLNGVSFGEMLHNPVHFKRMLADPALSHFRIWPGRV